MSMTVGAEYLVGNMLAHRKETARKDYVTFQEVSEVGWEIQKACNAADVDVIVDRDGYEVKAIVYDFPDYFLYARDYIGDNGPLIVSERSAEALRARFTGYLPLAILTIMVEQIEKHLK